jgi:hypothetical protein
LGRDVLNNWRIDYHPAQRKLTCDVISADHWFPLDRPKR